jgi:hypothetical protein
MTVDGALGTGADAVSGTPCVPGAGVAPVRTSAAGAGSPAVPGSGWSDRSSVDRLPVARAG